MSSRPQNQDKNVEAIKSDDRVSRVSRELSSLMDRLNNEFPHAIAISFEFQKELQLHVDVRTLEEAFVIEEKLPSLFGQTFDQISRGNSPHHGFFHRVSARAAASS